MKDWIERLKAGDKKAIAITAFALFVLAGFAFG